MQTYRERLTAPFSWWLTAVLFAVVWGWVALVATTWTIAIVVTVVIALVDLAAVWRYGLLLVEVRDDVLHVGPAALGSPHLGPARPLQHTEYRLRLGRDADARAHLATRPYLDRGVEVAVLDPSDPAPYWLVSSRHPAALAAALGHTGPDEPHSDGGPLVETE